MKRIAAQLGGLIMIAIILTACPYSSKVPISKEGSKVDAKNLGKWVKAADMAKDNPEFYQFIQEGENNYKVIKNEYESSGDSSYYKQEKFNAIITEIDDYTFLNMKPEASGDMFGGGDEYYIYRIMFNGSKSKFTLFEVTDNIDEKFETTEELYAFVKQNMHLSFFYNKDEVKYIKEYD